MSDDLKTRIQQRLDALGISARAASLKGGGSDSLVRNILTGASENPRGDTLKKLAMALEVSEQWLLSGEGGDDVSAKTPNVRFAADAPELITRSLPKDVPVLGTAAGAALGRGSFSISLDPVDYVIRPPGLLTAKNVYALYVEGDSMSPRFEPGELVYVSPNRPANIGDFVVIQEPAGSDTDFNGFIKKLVKRTPEWVETLQFNPAGAIKFKNTAALKIHRVLTWSDLFGV